MNEKVLSALLVLTLFTVSFAVGGIAMFNALYPKISSQILGETVVCKSSGYCQTDSECCSGVCEQMSFLNRLRRGARGICQPERIVTPTPQKPTRMPTRTQTRTSADETQCSGCENLIRELSGLAEKTGCGVFSEELVNSLTARIRAECNTN